MEETVLSQDELEAIDKTIELARLLGQLPVDRHADKAEVIAHLHGIQDWIAARGGYRALNAQRQHVERDI